MYTVYFLIRYEHVNEFKEDIYVEHKVTDLYHPLDDMALLARMDTDIQEKLDKHFGIGVKEAADCDFSIHLIPYNQYMAKSCS